MKMFWNNVVKYLSNSDLRIGQCFFLALDDVDPARASIIKGTSLDPFHQDDNIKEFLTYLQKEKII